VNMVNFVHVKQHNGQRGAGEITPLTGHLVPFRSLCPTKMQGAPLSQPSRAERR
jgi:hypothetical protein